MTAAPLPSPIPRAKGSRSAADEIFSQFLESSLHVPDLTLPPENGYFSIRPCHRDNGIDFELLLSRDGDAIGELIRSAREIGAFRINCHGDFKKELQSSVKRFLQVSEKERLTNGRSLDWASQFLEDPNFGCHSEEFKNVEKKLGAIAKEVLKILSEAIDRKLYIEEGEATLSIVFEPENCTRTKVSPYQNLTSKESSSSSSFALRVRIRIITDPSEFCNRSIFVTIGKQLQEWSDEELKSDSMDTILNRPEARIHGTRTWLSFEYELCLPTRDRTGVDRRTISLLAQVMICIFIAFLLKIFTYRYS